MNTEFMYSVLKVYAIFLQRFQHWKEATIDAFVVAMHRLHQYYWNKMKRGLAGLGNYQVPDRYSHEAKELQEMQVIYDYLL